MIMSRSVLLRIKIVFRQICRKNQNTHYLFNKFLSGSRALYGMIWKDKVEPDRLQKTVQSTCNTAHVLCMVDNKAKNTHLEYTYLLHGAESFLRS